MSEHSDRLVWTVVLTLALIVRVGAGLYWNSVVSSRATSEDAAPGAVEQDGPFFYGDSDSYWKLGRALAFGRPYEFDEERHWQIFRTPGYPALLAPLFWVYGENPPIIASRMEGALFGTLNVALVGWLALVLFGKNKRASRIAELAALVVALDPTVVLQSVSILSEEPFMTFSLLLNVCLIKAARALKLLPQNEIDPSPESQKLSLKRVLGYSASIALCTAAAIYQRPSWYYFVPFATLVLLALRFILDALRHEIGSNPFWTMKRLSAVVLLVVASSVFTQALLSPWTIRNYRVAGKLIPTTLQMGASLYDGLSPDATGASDMQFVDRFRAEELANPSDSENVHFEIRLDERMKAASIDWLKSHPREAARLAVVKFCRLWAPFPHDQAFSSSFLKLVLCVSYLPVLVLGLLGLITSLKRNVAAYYLAVPALYVTSLHVIFVSSIRYRVPVMYGFAILGAYWLVTILSKERERSAQD